LLDLKSFLGFFFWWGRWEEVRLFPWLVWRDVFEEEGLKLTCMTSRFEKLNKWVEKLWRKIPIQERKKFPVYLSGSDVLRNWCVPSLPDSS
jgi:hypothetical protein